MNVINVEVDHGATERTLFVAFYGCVTLKLGDYLVAILGTKFSTNRRNPQLLEPPNLHGGC